MTEQGPSPDHDEIIRLLCSPRTDDVRLRLNDLLYGDGEHTEDFPDNALDPGDLDRLTQQARQAEIDRSRQVARDRNARLEASRVAQRARFVSPVRAKKPKSEPEYVWRNGVYRKASKVYPDWVLWLMVVFLAVVAVAILGYVLRGIGYWLSEGAPMDSPYLPGWP